MNRVLQIYKDICSMIAVPVCLVMMGILWWHFHGAYYGKSCSVEAAQSSATSYIETVHLANGLDTTVTVSEINHKIDDDVYRMHGDIDGKGVRIERFIRRHNGTLDKVKEIHFGGLTVTEDTKK